MTWLDQLVLFGFVFVALGITAWALSPLGNDNGVWRFLGMDDESLESSSVDPLDKRTPSM